MTTFVRVQKHNGFTFWMKKSPALTGNLIARAMRRLESISCSGIGRQRRLEIYPYFIKDLCDFMGVTYDKVYYSRAVIADTHPRADLYKVTEHKTVDPNVDTKILNKLELYHRAGKHLPLTNAKARATKTFWELQA